MLATPRHVGWIVDDGVGLLTLNRPERKNPLTFESYAELRDLFRSLVDQPDQIKAVVLTGAGGNFCSGGDVHEIIGPLVAMDLPGKLRFTQMTGDLVKAMRHCPQPIVAAVEGWAVGAGLGLALCCDTVVAADSAKFMTGFGKIGLIADFGLLHTLPRRVGEGRARQILLYGEQMDASAAERIGLVDHVVPAGTALDAALAQAAKFDTAAPLPLAMTKSFLAKGLAESLDWERNVQSTLFLTADHVEGRDAFMAKRVPAFKGA